MSGKRAAVKCWLRDRLWGLSDRLCALGQRSGGEPGAGYPPRRGMYRLTFEAGHQIGELGWRLR